MPKLSCSERLNPRHVSCSTLRVKSITYILTCSFNIVRFSYFLMTKSIPKKLFSNLVFLIKRRNRNRSGKIDKSKIFSYPLHFFQNVMIPQVQKILQSLWSILWKLKKCQHKVWCQDKAWWTVMLKLLSQNSVFKIIILDCYWGWFQDFSALRHRQPVKIKKYSFRNCKKYFCSFITEFWVLERWKSEQFLSQRLE